MDLRQLEEEQERKYERIRYKLRARLAASRWSGHTSMRMKGYSPKNAKTSICPDNKKRKKLPPFLRSVW